MISRLLSPLTAALVSALRRGSNRKVGAEIDSSAKAVAVRLAGRRKRAIERLARAGLYAPKAQAKRERKNQIRLALKSRGVA